MQTVVFSETFVKITTQHHVTFHQTAVYSLLVIYVQLFHLHEIFGGTHCPFGSLTAHFLPPVMLLACIMLLPSVLSWNVVVSDAFPHTVSCPTTECVPERHPAPGQKESSGRDLPEYDGWELMLPATRFRVPFCHLLFVILCMAFLFLSRLFVFYRYPFETLAWLQGILNENFFFIWMPGW